MADLLIKNITIIDGTGAPAFVSDLAITGEKISHLDKNLDLEAGEILDGTGLCLSPGFIDIHTHSDFTLLLAPEAHSRVCQGVTTEVTGNCGGSPGPIGRTHRKAFMEYMTDLGGYYKREFKDRDWHWQGLDQFFQALAAKGTSVNLVPLVGHSTLRAHVMGYEGRGPDRDEMGSMKTLLEQELEAGAFGFSSGLIYHPGAFAGTRELAELAGVTAKFGGLYSTHMRSEGKFLFEAVDEAVEVARDSGVSLEISHLKCETPVLWGKSGQLLEKIQAARDSGINVNFDQYPYTAYFTGLLEIFPPWAKETGATRLMETLATRPGREKVRRDMACPPEEWDNPLEGLGFDHVRILGFRNPDHRGFNGRTVADLSREMNLDPLETVFELFCREKGGLGMVVFAMSEADLETILAHPLGMVGSDGSSATPGGPVGSSPVHPRFYGTFPRVLSRYVREKKVLFLETAIHKMTGMPARKLGLKDRGVIREGMAADLVLFDPDTVKDRADFTAPHQTPEGIAHVFVNGTRVVNHGDHTGARPGRRLSRG